MQQKIIHIDMDCFFAAVEMRDFPQYRNIPLAVGGPSNKRGVISTCNYKARAFGVRSAMPSSQALKLCPNLTLVPGRMSVYKQISKQLYQIFKRYTHIIEPLSFDEAYLDVTDASILHGSATLIARAIRQDIEKELQLTASAGIAPIKFLAKIASDINKPNGITVITPNEMQAHIDKLKLEQIPGVGKVAIEKLHQAGFYTCLDVKQANYRQFLLQFGRLGASLWQRSHGIDERKVESQRERKSVGVERTFEHNIFTFAQCEQIIKDELFPELKKRLFAASSDMAIIKQGIKLKFADFQQTTIEHQNDNLNLEDFHFLLERIMQRQKGREIRLLGISVMLKPEVHKRQLSLLEPLLN